MNWFKKLMYWLHPEPWTPPLPPTPVKVEPTPVKVEPTPVKREPVEIFYVGQRVMTTDRLGAGTVGGFEVLTSTTCFTVDFDPVDEHPGARVVVRLDDPTLWVCRSDTCPNPFIFRREVHALK